MKDNNTVGDVNNNVKHEKKSGEQLETEKIKIRREHCNCEKDSISRGNEKTRSKGAEKMRRQDQKEDQGPAFNCKQ